MASSDSAQYELAKKHIKATSALTDLGRYVTFMARRWYKVENEHDEEEYW